MKRAAMVAGGVLLGFSIAAAEAATDKSRPYPNRPIRLVVPFAPGGPSDVLSRLLGAKLTESMGETIVIDNRGSVGGILGAELAAQSDPDGYTMLMSANSLMTINPLVYKKLPYDPQRDFQPITQLTSGGNVVVVHPSVAAQSIKEFIALAKANPGKFNYATTGTGNLLGIAAFKVQAGIDMVPIAYKGTGQAANDLIAGQVQFFFMSPLVAVPHVKSGRLRALAVTSLTRNPALPDIPTVSDSGLPGFKNITWHGILVPARTPGAIVKRLNAELVKIVKLPEISERFAGQGLTAVGSTPDQMRALIKEETAEYAQVVKHIGLQPQ